jgi:tetratricopeptide (TPR) repeat protein
MRLAQKAPSRLVNSPEEGAALVFLNFAWSAYEQAIERAAAAEEAGFSAGELVLDMPLSLAQLALAVDPSLDSAHYLIASIATAQERHADAEAALAAIAPSSWLYNFAVIDRAAAATAQGNQDAAIAILRNFLEQDALAPDIALELGNALAAAGDKAGALAAISDAIRVADFLSSDETRDENLWRYYFERGAIASTSGDWPAAEADLREALKRAPNQPIVLNFLGYSYVERGERLDEAFSMIERALAAMPTSGSITDSLGWAYYQRGDYQKAVDYLEQAVALSPSNAVISDHLGDAYFHAGKLIEARYEWRHAAQFGDADAELKAKIERKLAGEAPKPGALVASGAP